MDRAEYLESIGLHLGWNKNLVKCQICHGRWHSIDYETCYDCRPPWLRFDRREFSDDQRIDIMDRDNYQCSACGTRDEYLQVDHIKPCALGGEADLWNGQVLCAKCNHEKASDWWATKWPERRIELMHFYLTFGWPWLSYRERETLVDEALSKREVIGYSEFCGTVETAWLESPERKVIITKQHPRALTAGEQGAMPEYIQVYGWIEERKAVFYGDQFTWHSHVRGSPEIPRWAEEMADLCPDRCACVISDEVI